jgi:hypothetical protein
MRGLGGTGEFGALAEAWCCSHGEAIYRPTRVQLPPLTFAGQEHVQQAAGALAQDQANADARSSPPARPDKMRRLSLCGGGGDDAADNSESSKGVHRTLRHAVKGKPAFTLGVTSVFAGPWHTIILVA